MKIVMATGGTGGHIYPALSLADYLRDNYNSEVVFVGNSNKMEANIIPSKGYKFIGINAQGLTGNIVNKLMAFSKTYLASFNCVKILKEERADIVVGFGGYVSYPVALAAKRLKIPFILHEQNSIPGKANLMLAKHSEKIVVCYPEAFKSFPKDKTLLLGNPRSTDVLKVKENRELLTEIGLDKDKKTVLIVMGSLGSETIAEVVKQSLEQLQDKEYQLIFVTGEKVYDKYQSLKFSNVAVVPYIDQMAYLKSIDLIIARGGATTASEILAAGIASIIIPSPYVANNHQYINATYLKDNNAAIIIEEKDLTADILVETIDTILGSEVLENMKKNAIKLANLSAAEDISELIISMVKKD